MKQTSAGILLYRFRNGLTEVLLVHPGGPFWKNKDFRAWDIPKGGIHDAEDPLAAAIREVREETGITLSYPLSAYHPLGKVRSSSGKETEAWALRAHRGEVFVGCRTTTRVSMKTKNGTRTFTVPEIERGAYVDLPTARQKLYVYERDFLDRLETWLTGVKT